MMTIINETKKEEIKNKKCVFNDFYSLNLDSSFIIDCFSFVLTNKLYNRRRIVLIRK